MFFRHGAANHASQDLIKLLGPSSSRKPTVNEASWFYFINNALYSSAQDLSWWNWDPGPLLVSLFHLIWFNYFFVALLLCYAKDFQNSFIIKCRFVQMELEFGAFFLSMHSASGFSSFFHSFVTVHENSQCNFIDWGRKSRYLFLLMI